MLSKSTPAFVSASAAGLVCFALLGCGSSQEAPPPKSANAAKSASSNETNAFDQSPPKAPEKLERTAIKAVLPTGLPWLLRRVWPEEAFKEGKFAGWRLVAIPEEWTGLDLRPDDIVTRINGKGVETPEQLWDSWTALATATELRVTYERGTETKEMVLPIEGAPDAELFASLNNPSPPARKPSTKRTTIVIEGRDPLGTLGDGD